MTQPMRRMGIDPGKTNLGWAILDFDDTVIESGVINVGKIGITNTVNLLSNKADDYGVTSLGMERYVAYEGVHNASSEDILMVTGALFYALDNRGIEVKMCRAIDWKPKVCKHLFKTRKFRNPSKQKKFDKDYSLAAAECIIGDKPRTDHEADAICLAYYGGLAL